MSDFTHEEVEARRRMAEAIEVNPNYQVERLRRARFKGDPEWREILAPVDPRTIDKAAPLTKSQHQLMDDVFAVAFKRSQST